LKNGEVLLIGGFVYVFTNVIFEIRRGLRPSEQKRILHLFDALVRLRFDEGTWDAAGALDASLRKKGMTIPPMDILIASVCRHHKTPLFTLDQHFGAIPGLKCVSMNDVTVQVV